MSGLVTKSPSGLLVVGKQPVSLLTRGGPLGGGGAGLPITSQLVAWFDPQSLLDNGLSPDDPIELWLDESGNENNLVQSNASHRPVIKDEVLGSKPGVLFDTDKLLTFGVNNFSGVSLNHNGGPFSLLVVAKVPSISDSSYLVSKNSGPNDTSGFHFLYRTNSGQRPRFNLWNFGSSSGLNYDDNNIHYLILVWDGTTATLYADGNFIYNPGTGVSSRADNIVIGSCRENDPTNSLEGHMGHLGFWSKALSSEERAEVDTFIEEHYGLGA